MSLKQPKIKTSEWVLYFGMACYGIGAFVSIFSVGSVDPNCSFDCHRGLVWPLVVGSVIGLVCFIVAMRDEG